jgi:hypothetical protein
MRQRAEIAARFVSQLLNSLLFFQSSAAVYASPATEAVGRRCTNPRSATAT